MVSTMHLFDLPVELFKSILEHAALACELGPELLARVLFHKAFVGKLLDQHHTLVALRQTAYAIRGHYRNEDCEVVDEAFYEWLSCQCMARMRYSNTMNSLTGHPSPAFHAPNDPKETFWSRFTLAAYLGDLAIVKDYYSGMDINPCSHYFSDPMSAAAAQGHTDIVQHLLSQGADANTSTALEKATESNYYNVTDLLLNPSTKIKPSSLTLHRSIINAASGGHLQLLQTLLSCVMSLYPENSPLATLSSCLPQALFEACRNGATETAKFLMSAPFNLSNATFRSDHTSTSPDLLQTASKHGRVNIISLLFSISPSRTDLLEYGSINNQDALWLASSRGFLSVIRLLLDAGASPYGYYRSGSVSPLIAAAEHGQADAASMLLSDPGYNVDENKILVARAMDRACMGGYESVVKVLADFGATIHHGGGGRSLIEKIEKPGPMLVALQYGRQNVVRVLTELGVESVDPAQSIFAEKFANGVFPMGVIDW
ncbi:MAG: hypothetical protein Q9227_007494 [Pyrenula ochraceoflavens]